MLQAVYQLTTRRPHEPDEMRLTRAERPIYTSGYYCALTTALRCLELVAVKRALWRREQRRKAAEAAAAARALVLQLEHGVREQVGIALDGPMKERAQNPSVTERNFVALVSLRVAVTDGDDNVLGRAVNANADDHRDRGDIQRQAPTIHPDGVPAQLPDEPEELSQFDRDTALIAGGYRGGELALRHLIGAERKPRERKTSKLRPGRVRG
jgi:hypothetical protein